jgi:CHAT domain-containing protein
MLALMEEQGPGYAYAHPLFWAPYALIGDGGR